MSRATRARRARDVSLAGRERRGRPARARRRPRHRRRRPALRPRRARDARARAARRRRPRGRARRAARHRGAPATARQGTRMSEHPLKIRILLADDHTVVRRGLRMVLEAAPDLEVVAEASDGIEAVERALREDIDLAILDVAMPRRTGLQAARELSRAGPTCKLLMLSMHEVEQYFFEAIKAGASGYVLKTAAEPRPRRGVPVGDARRAVPLPARGARDHPRLPRPRRRRRRRARGAADRARARGRQARRRGVHERARSPSC